MVFWNISAIIIHSTIIKLDVTHFKTSLIFLHFRHCLEKGTLKGTSTKVVSGDCKITSLRLQVQAL
jgi:hypothetical protein